MNRRAPVRAPLAMTDSFPNINHFWRNCKKTSDIFVQLQPPGFTGQPCIYQFLLCNSCRRDTVAILWKRMSQIVFRQQIEQCCPSTMIHLKLYLLQLPIGKMPIMPNNIKRTTYTSYSFLHWTMKLPSMLQTYAVQRDWLHVACHAPRLPKVVSASSELGQPVASHYSSLWNNTPFGYNVNASFLNSQPCFVNLYNSARPTPSHFLITKRFYSRSL